jgi:glycosyltransferase involved in cell wall biosynthesis
MQKKVLIVSYSFPPSNAPAAQRAFYFAKYLPENNVQPFVLTTTKNISSLGYGNSMNTEGMNIIDTSGNNSNTLVSNNHQNKTSKNIVKTSWLKKLLVQLMIPDRGIIWLPSALKYGSRFLKNNTDVKVVFATAPSFTNLLIALILAKRFNKKLICDFRDFYVVNGLFKRIFPLNFLDSILEKQLIKSSSQLIFISKNMKQVYENKYPEIVQKTNLIYNGFDDADFNFTNTLKQNHDKLKIFFAGSLYYESTHPRDIFQLLNSLDVLIKKGLIEKNKIEIKIAAYIHPELQQRLDCHNLKTNIVFLGVIKREDVLTEMQQSNLLWHMLGNSKQDMGAIPIKTFEYMASQKPVLFFVPKNAELEEVATEFNLGYTCYIGNEFQSYNEEIMMKAYQDIVIDKKNFVSSLDRFKIFKRQYQALQLSNLISQIT